MKKSTRIALIVAGGMIVLGGAVCTLMWAFGIGGRAGLPERLSVAVSHEEQTLPIAADGSVRVHVMTDDVTVGVSPDAKAHLSYVDTTFVKNVVTADAGAITLTQEVVHQTVWPDPTRWIAEWYDGGVTLLLPKGFSGEVILTASTGSIVAERLDVSLLSLDCTTGNIRLTDIQAETVAVGASTGSVGLTDVAVDGDLTVITTTGQAMLNNVSADALERRASTGSTVLSDVTAGSVFVNATTGDVSLKRLKTDKATIALSTGDVYGTLLGSKADYVDALDIRTTTGDVALAYEN